MSRPVLLLFPQFGFNKSKRALVYGDCRVWLYTHARVCMHGGSPGCSQVFPQGQRVDLDGNHFAVRSTSYRGLRRFSKHG